MAIWIGAPISGVPFRTDERFPRGLLLSLQIVTRPRSPKPSKSSTPRTRSIPPLHSFNPSLPPSLGDTLQLLALHRPNALRLIETWATILARPIRERLDDERARRLGAILFAVMTALQ